MTPLIGTLYNHPGEMLGCEDYKGEHTIIDDGSIPFRWFRTLVASHVSASELHEPEHVRWHSPTLELEVDMQASTLVLLTHAPETQAR